MSNLKERYQTEIVSKLQKELGYSNVMRVPKITKITLNMGVGAAAQDKKAIEGAVKDMTAIAGQKPVVLRRENLLLALKLERVGPLDVRSLYVVVRCMNSLID